MKISGVFKTIALLAVLFAGSTTVLAAKPKFQGGLVDLCRLDALGLCRSVGYSQEVGRCL